MTSKDSGEYAKDADEARGGKAVGPQHDGSFHAPDFYDPKTGKRIPTDWDDEVQANLPAQPVVTDGELQAPAKRQTKVPDQK